MLKTLYYDENVIQNVLQNNGVSFVVVCGKMGQEEDVAQESKVKELDQQDTLRQKGVMKDKKIHS